MKKENGKVIEATENELYRLYLSRGMDDIMSFPEYLWQMQHSGCTVKEETA